MHSDRESQYHSQAYQAIIDQQGLLCSMSARAFSLAHDTPGAVATTGLRKLPLLASVRRREQLRKDYPPVSARDALVLKALAQLLPAQLQLHPAYTHVKGYYAATNHHHRLNQFGQNIKHPFIYDLLSQFVRRTIEHGGLYRDIERGIAHGCPLNPLIGAYHLRTLDQQISRAHLHYDT